MTLRLPGVSWRCPYRVLVRTAVGPGVLGVLLGLVAPAAASASPRSEPPSAGGCSLLPADNVWNAPVDELPIHPSSAAWVSRIGPVASLASVADASSDGGEADPDVLWLEVTRPARPVEVAFRFEEESDPGPYPIPAAAGLELASLRRPARLILLDVSQCVLYELHDVLSDKGSWSAAWGAVYSLRSNQLRPGARVPERNTGLPIFPGLLRFDEIAEGEIRHALRFSAPALANTFVWPARRAENIGFASLPPVGQRFRLRADLDISRFSERVGVVLRALQRYGMILSEVGSPWGFSSAGDGRWTDAERAELATVRGSDFRAVDGALLRIAEDSGRVRTQLQVQPLSSPGDGPFECASSAEVACAGGGRFEVRVDWADSGGTPTPARIAPVRSDDSVLFWFYEPSNWELMVKVVDGCAINDHHWVFFAGTTDQGFALSVTDSRTGERLVYSSAPGRPATAVTDSDAFPSCRKQP